MITKDFINDIREEVAAKIQAAIDAQELAVPGSSVIASVYAFPKSTMEGFPAVVVMTSENEVAYASTGSVDSRKITLVFSLNVYYPKNKEDDAEDAEAGMGEAVSELLRIFCVKQALSTADLSSIALTPWGETTAGEANFRTAQVILRCSKYVDTIYYVI